MHTQSAGNLLRQLVRLLNSLLGQCYQGVRVEDVSLAVGDKPFVAVDNVLVVVHGSDNGVAPVLGAKPSVLLSQTQAPVFFL